jgi:steroid 5-alpha reductase family enzyme
VTHQVLIASAVGILALIIVTWLISLLIRDASIIDIAWGLGFVIVALISLVEGQGSHNRRVLMLAMVGLWGLRLSGYLAWRNLGKGEDYRYRSMRQKWGENFWITSLLRIYLVQAVLIFVVSLPVQLSAASLESKRGFLSILGIGLWAVGFLCESVGDFQLARFKGNPENEGKVMDRGLWRYTRHPNYFGDFCVWWGIWLVAAETDLGKWGIVGPIVMSILLLRVSGVALLERTISKRRPDYDAYVARTSPFVPWLPKRFPDERAAAD